MMAQMAQKEGVSLINFLMQKAVPLHEENTPSPTSVREWIFCDILKLPKKEQEEWKTACWDKLEALKRGEVFEITNLPKGHKIIENRWVFDIKTDGRKKACLVAKGFSQVEEINFFELFSPVVCFKTVRFMLALSSLEDWHVQGLDVRNAFLYGKLDEEMYMEQPEGFKVKGQENKVLHLRHALYSLKQAALAWWKELVKSMKELGFKSLSSDAGLFVYKTDRELIIAIVYVDDAMFFGPDYKFFIKKKQEFMDKWECHDLGKTKDFLCMNIKRNKNMVYLDQTAYLDKVLKHFQMSNAKAVQTPLSEDYSPTPNTGLIDSEWRSLYQQVIKSLLYLMLGTCPDICFAITKMLQFSANTSQEHLDKAMYIFKYLAGTSRYALIYNGHLQKGLMAYTDSDWVADKAIRQSVTAYFFKIANGIFSWQTQAQRTVAQSSTEAEHMALFHCSWQAMWLKTMLAELGMPLKAVPIYGDNQGAIFNAFHPVQKKWIKHIDIQYHYIRECVQDGKVKLYYVEGINNPADLFTKNLGPIKFSKFRSQLGLEFYLTWVMVLQHHVWWTLVFSMILLLSTTAEKRCT
jgi:Reverse transcriptase (RNA-dependent DNA polymerase)